VLQLIHDGRLKAVKPYRDWLIDKASLEAHRENRRPKGRPPGTLSKEPPRNRAGTGESAEREREYQRNYKRRLRAAGKLTLAKKGKRGSKSRK